MRRLFPQTADSRSRSARLLRSGFIEPPCHRLMPVRGHGQCVKFLEMAPPLPRPHPPTFPDALISELAGFYSFLEEFFRSDNSWPCLQPLAMATGVAFAAPRLREGGSSIVPLPPPAFPPTHTHRDVLSPGVTVTVQNQQQKASGGRHSYLRLGISPLLLLLLLAAASHS